MARDTGGIIVTSKRETRPLLHLRNFPRNELAEKFARRVGCTRHGGNRPEPAKTPSSTSSTTIRKVDILRELVRFRSRIFIPEVPTRGMKPVGTPALFERAAYTTVETSGLAKSNRLHEEAEVEGRGESGCLVSAEQHRPTSK